MKQDASRKSRRERMKAMSGSNLAKASGGNLEKLAHSRQESLSDFGLASAGSLYGGSMDDLTSLNGSETESSLGPGTPACPVTGPSAGLSVLSSLTTPTLSRGSTRTPTLLRRLA